MRATKNLTFGGTFPLSSSIKRVGPLGVMSDETALFSCGRLTVVPGKKVAAPFLLELTIDITILYIILSFESSPISLWGDRIRLLDYKG